MLELYYQNTRGLRTKLTQLRKSVSTTDYDIIVLSETWLHLGINSNELGMENYVIYRLDRNVNTSVSVRGGGVLIAVKKTLPSHSIKTDQNTVEHLFVEVMVNGSPILIGAVYIPPRSDYNCYLNHCQTLESIIETLLEKHPVIICGDYNLPNCKWTNDQNVTRIFGNVSEKSVCLENTVNYCNLLQINQVSNEFDEILDLVFCDNPNAKCVKSVDRLIQPDIYHPPLSITYLLNACDKNTKSTHFYYDFKNTNFYDLCQCLSIINWNVVFSSSDINVCLNSFYEILHYFIELYVPKKKYGINNFPKWFSSELKNKIFAKKRAHKNYKNQPTDVN